MNLTILVNNMPSPVPKYIIEYIPNYTDFYYEIPTGWDNVNLDEYVEDIQMTDEYDSTTEYNSYSDCEFDSPNDNQ